ncbi:MULTISPECIES: helix-turn-helix domain-containing protein [Phyllobacterium]|uniref:helix-turn-helix transcriptional regulator n=1 Tax=Phyllobacterium TaxID=28100 RepID=UPI001CBE2756|nr:helix-turn-helix transcriptional regulator [Phyllobacterium calauticae]MBZ3695501.1 helix-turn-helix transcriptional regulator [Phyllobacterium calauticae]
MSPNPKATKQELMVLRRIPSRNESEGIEIAELAEALRASLGATYHVLAQLYSKDLIRTDTEELSERSRRCFRTDTGDHVLMRQSAKGMREVHDIAA